MFNALKFKMAGAFLGNLLKSLATDPHTRSTTVGTIAAVVLGIGLNYGALVQGDPHQIALLVSSIAVWGIGVLATKANRNGHTTFLGILAGASQAYVGNFTTALTLALCGYFSARTPPPAAPTGISVSGAIGATRVGGIASSAGAQ